MNIGRKSYFERSDTISYIIDRKCAGVVYCSEITRVWCELSKSLSDFLLLVHIDYYVSIQIKSHFSVKIWLFIVTSV